MSAKGWLTAILLFFGWGFVMHAVGLLLHEFGGHALTATALGCGIDDYALTFFGHGQVHRRPCGDWSMAAVLVVDWSGLVITSAVGAAAAWVVHEKKSLPPMWRLLLALVAFFFLLGQLGYATNGGFHDLYDPGRTARWLGERGLHVLAWVPTLIAYAVAAVVCAQNTVDAFREHFGPKTRLQTLGWLAATLGAAGILYFLAFRIEWQIRTDLAMRGVAVEAERVAELQHRAPPFPIDKVLLVVALAAVTYAFARPVKGGAGGAGEKKARPLPPRLAAIVALSTAACFLLVFILIVARSS